jgi:hypothetical protein
VVIGCAANLDDDDAVDVWTISSADRQLGGAPVPRGTAFHHLSDKEQ